jgi:WhiB family redox-sensing transcriptional regulator
MMRHSYPYESWMARGACRGLDTAFFFPEELKNLKGPQAVCAECDVRETCLEYAITHSINYGVWGGTSERTRRSIRSTRAKSA